MLLIPLLTRLQDDGHGACTVGASAIAHLPFPWDGCLELARKAGGINLEGAGVLWLGKSSLIPNPLGRSSLPCLAPRAPRGRSEAPGDERGSKIPLNRVNRTTRRDQGQKNMWRNAGAPPSLCWQGWWLCTRLSGAAGLGAHGVGCWWPMGLIIDTQGALQGAVWTWVECKSLLTTLNKY